MLVARGCNTLTGRFEVLEAVFGPLGYIERFHATFEEHCEGASPAVFGEVLIVNPPPPPRTVTLVLDRNGVVKRVTGTATVHGACHRTSRTCEAWPTGTCGRARSIRTSVSR